MMEEGSSEARNLTVDLYYNGRFAQNPLVYLDAVRVRVQDVDFGGLGLRECRSFLTKLTKGSCENIYYCSKKQSLAEGIRRIDNEADYYEFIEDGYAVENEFTMNLFIDHQNEPILDWADREVLDEGEEGEEEGEELDEDDDKESHDSFTVEYEHEDDEEVPTLDKTTSDAFLNKLSGITGNGSDDDDADEANDEEQQAVVYPVHDEKQEWHKMVPVLGMKFSNPEELKQCATNYAVKNGYDLWYEKNDHKRLLVKCGKGKKNKKGKSCPFRLWATWMARERSF